MSNAEECFGKLFDKAADECKKCADHDQCSMWQDAGGDPAKAKKVKPAIKKEAATEVADPKPASKAKSADKGAPMTAAVSRSIAVDVGFPLQLVTLPDLVELKLLAAESQTRRRSKSVQDAADIVKLIEEHPELGSDKIEQRIIAAFIKRPHS